MKIQMKYSLGDRFVEKFSGTEYTIEEWKAEKTADGLTISYSFHPYLDDIIDYHQFFEEGHITDKGSKYNWLHPDRKTINYQLSCDDPHPCEVEVSELDHNGDKIEIGDTVYVGTLYSTFGTGDGYTADAKLSFASWDEVTKLVFKQERHKNMDGSYTISAISSEIVSERRGPCSDADGEEYRDGRSYGMSRTAFLRYSFKNVTDWFVEKYISELRRHQYERNQLLSGGNWMHDARQILYHMGILDRVLEAVQNKSPSKKTPAKKKASKKKVDWEKIAKKLAAEKGVDLDELINCD